MDVEAVLLPVVHEPVVEDSGCICSWVFNDERNTIRLVALIDKEPRTDPVFRQDTTPQ